MESFSIGSLVTYCVFAAIPLMLTMGAVLLFKLRSLQSALLTALGASVLFTLFLHDWTKAGGGLESLIRGVVIFVIVGGVVALVLRGRWKKKVVI